MTPQVGEIWQHHKTKGEYEIIAIGKLQTKVTDLDLKECVIYKAPNNTLWVRPLIDFIEIIKNEDSENVPRFKKVR